MRHPRHIAIAFVALALGVALSLSACTRPVDAPKPSAPNVLWVVWDTVRADRLQAYGYDKPTTPHLVRWAADARLFSDCQSTANSTVPSTAAMFTGLLPDRHRMSHDYRWLDDGHVTTAERFKEAGYATFLWASNPHLSSEANFTQGFDVEHHPWDRLHRSHASNIVREKVREDRATQIGRSGRANHLRPWHLSASGRLAGPTLSSWLDRIDEDRPWFAFVNLMEAHQPYIPPRKYRERVMDAAAVERSYRQNRGPAAWWGFVFGFFEYSDYDLEVLGGTYDATLAELDDIFHGLLQELDRRGVADDTIVVLTADHGEHLGEHHLLDHQYTLYQPVLNVPLIVRAPGRIEAGVDPRPVMNFDLYPTLLELAGLAPPPADAIDAVSLLEPSSERDRVSMHPATFPVPFRHARQHDPDFDFTPFRRRFEALRSGESKLIRSSLGERELFNLATDPGETQDLSASERALTREIDGRLTTWRNTRPRRERERDAAPTLSEEQQKRLRALGYAE